MEQKNVIILMCDQLRKDCLGTYGNRYIQTPHIDALAQDGVRYERCYVTNPVCMPSRMSIFTGMYPRNHGLWANGVVLEDTKQTLMHHLVAYGWQTASIGKIHFEPTQDPTGQQSREARCLWENRKHTMQAPYWGFQYTQMTIGHGDVVGDYLNWFYEKGGTDEQRGVTMIGAATGRSNTPKHLHYCEYIGEQACTYLTAQRNKTQSFFLCVSFPDPHLPFAPVAELGQERPIQKPIGDVADLITRPTSYQAHYRQGHEADKGLLEKFTRDEVVQMRVGYTYDMIEWVDEQIGKIVSTLKDEGIYEETIIVVLSDHGELLGDHGLWRKGNALYEGLVNIPFIVVDHTHKGVVDEKLLSTIDLFPTLCDLLQMQVPGYVDGKSLYAKDRKPYCLVEYRPQAEDCVYAMISHRYKYIRYQSGEHELTDLYVDPEERTNQINQDDYEPVIAQMQHQLLDELISNYTNKTQKQFAY